MDKTAVIILIIGLLITWLLASSIGTLIKIKEASGSPGGNSLFPRVNLPQPAIALPPINITLPQHVNETKGSILDIPLIPLPIIMPNIPINASNYISINTPGQEQSQGGEPGLVGSQVGSGNSQYRINTAVMPFKVPPPLLIIVILIAAVMIIGLSLLMITRGSHREYAEAKNISESKSIMQLGISTAGNNVSGGMMRSMQGIELLPSEVVKPMVGWGGGSAIIDLAIPRDLPPLVWSYGKPLPIRARDGSTLTVSSPGIIRDGYVIMPSVGCYGGVNAALGDHEETLFIRASDYGGDDVVKFTRLNVGAFVNRDSETIREVVGKLVNEGIVVDVDSINKVIRIFEKVKYGLKDVDRHEYEEFLRALRNAFREAG